MSVYLSLGKSLQAPRLLRDEGYFVAVRRGGFGQLAVSVGDQLSGGVERWREDAVVAQLQYRPVTRGRRRTVVVEALLTAQTQTQDLNDCARQILHEKTTTQE